MEQISLSPSKLNLFRDCPRCFYDAYTLKCPKPRGIMASLPGGMDRIMKKYVDQFRGRLPQPLEGVLPGVLFSDMDKMKKWRHWRAGLRYVDEVNNIVLIGGLDDCLVDGNVYIPLDWKTKGSCPKDNGAQYYQNQIDDYNLMLDANGYPTRDEGWLVYIYPTEASSDRYNEQELKELHVISVEFVMQTYKLDCSKERAKEVLIKAAECLRGKRPAPTATCEHCNYLHKIHVLREKDLLDAKEKAFS